MKILARKEAKALNLTQYYTGKPCVNGHLTYRYVQSGTCAACVSSSTAANREAKPAAVNINILISNLVGIKVLAYHADWGTIRDTAAGLCVARYPDIPFDRVTGRMVAEGSNKVAAMYRIFVHGDDIPIMNQIAETLYEAHPPAVVSLYDQLTANWPKSDIAPPMPERL